MSQQLGKIVSILSGPVVKGTKATAWFAKIGRNVISKWICHTDYERWTNSESFEVWWDARTVKIAQLVPRGSRVIEFGAGRRQLEKLLDPSCSYVPSDLTDRGPGTIICDLNQRPLPDLRHVGADAAVFGGVLEYIRDLDSLVSWLSGQFRFCIASYAYFDPSKGAGVRIQERLQRFYHGYMNSYTETEIVALFHRHGYVRDKEETWTNQRIFQFDKRPAVSASRAGAGDLS